MHSGARRFVVLDFGAPVMLTDMIVPACCDLVLLSVDVWLCSEEQDGQRLVVASDIATKALVLSDLQPPPICRYLKVSIVIGSNHFLALILLDSHLFLHVIVDAP